MSSGIRIWGAAGNLELDENSFTVRVVYSALIPYSGGRFINISIPEVESTNYTAVCVPVVPYSTDAQSISAIAFSAVISNGVVSVFFGNPSTNTGPVGITTQRLIVMRWR